jgi:hypothetical protein
VQNNWRILLDNVTTDTEISELQLGRRLEFPLRNVPTGFDPRDGRRSVPGARYIQGAPLAIQRIYRGRAINANFRFLTDAWLEADSALNEYRYWYRNSARLGEPFLATWAYNTLTYLDNDHVWGILEGVPRIRRQNHILEGSGDMLGGINSLQLRVVGI